LDSIDVNSAGNQMRECSFDIFVCEIPRTCVIAALDRRPLDFEQQPAQRRIDVGTGLVETMRGKIAMMRLDFVRNRAIEVCIGIQPLQLDALQMCEILVHACGPLAPVISFHHWWAIATTVKHFKL
jgi:hypothetical protein